MNTKNISIILTQSHTAPNGKTTNTSRKINNLNPEATTNDLRKFAETIATLTGEHYDQIEVVKTFIIKG
ncbi:DUF1659 domain-containing protein [Staphylococcus americanisciuri]|uniref:DUF1659 domain-containing protein n=1 Tax=Staphylococcus americanisciuri TaxID=2973940 RepID=A0ABT2F216_9STAP|nr:DUF1659 domain-containing protein [Staphylococcus americanisciuri]MCS4486505.1 DUF1659 domain-containing protein [Staphylococcus americanisciuri]